MTSQYPMQPSPSLVLGEDHLLSHRTVSFTEQVPGSCALDSPDYRTSVHTSSLAEADFDVDVDSGFLPPQAPLCKLEGSPWNTWEEAWAATSGFRPGSGEDDNQKVREWRHYIRAMMPVICARPLQELGVIELRRAHSLLTFLTHIYVHSEARQNALQPDYQPVVPRALAVPLCQVSDALHLPPILTYADTVLYNWKLKDPKLGLSADNIQIPLTFTRTESEAHFFRTSLLTEAVGPICLGLIRSSLDEAFVGDELSINRISENLAALKVAIQQITSILVNVRTACDPTTFYWEIRPWFLGGRWIMEGVTADPGPWRIAEFSGPSAGQSTLIHSIDVFLGVDHTPRPGEVSKDQTFMNQMANYMPHFHRLFLQNLSLKSHQIRSLVHAAGTKSALAEGYNSAVCALEGLRSAHSRIALLYISSQSRISPPSGSAFVKEWEEKMKAEWQKQQLAFDKPGAEETHTGTGGTDLAKFLKRCRQRTKEALV